MGPIRAILLGLGTLTMLAIFAPQAKAQTGRVVASCGGAGYLAGTFNYPTYDTGGGQCSTTTGASVVQGSVSNASDGVATTSTNVPTVSYTYVWNGTTWDRAKGAGGAISTSTPPYQATTQVASMQKGVATSAAVGLTVPANTLFCVVQPQIANLNYESDGTNPVTGATGGLQLNLGTVLTVAGAAASSVRLINQTASSGALFTSECYK